jgi:hypothetical protein
MAESLQIITPRLLTAQMCVDTHVTSSTRQGFTLTVGDVLLGLGITVLLGHAEIDHVNDIGGLGGRPADKKVVWFDISVD